MKNLVLLLALVALSSTAVFAGGATSSIDLDRSVVSWKGYKVTGSHTGTVDLKSGDLTFDKAGALTGGAFVIDLNSIKCTDLEGETAGKLVGHLTSPDFFDVAEYPTASLVITNVAAKGTPGDYKVTGDLTIKGITKSIKFYTNITDELAVADLEIDRTDFNVQYGSGNFIKGLGDKTIYDEFELSISLAL